MQKFKMKVCQFLYCLGFNSTFIYFRPHGMIGKNIIPIFFIKSSFTYFPNKDIIVIFGLYCLFI